MGQTTIPTHTRAGNVVSQHPRTISDRAPALAEDDDAAQTAAREAFSAAVSDAPAVDLQEIGWKVQPHLDEDFLPEAVGTVEEDRHGIYAPSDGFDFDKVEQLGTAVGVRRGTIEGLQSARDHLREERQTWETALNYSDSHDNEVIRLACGVLADRMSAKGDGLTDAGEPTEPGDLVVAGEQFEQAWSDFRIEFAQRAGPVLIEKGIFAGPDRYDGYELLGSPDEICEQLVGSSDS